MARITRYPILNHLRSEAASHVIRYRNGRAVRSGRGVEAGQELQIVSELDEGGVLFGDGIETDRLAFGWGVQATVRVAQERLRLVQAAA